MDTSALPASTGNVTVDDSRRAVQKLLGKASELATRSIAPKREEPKAAVSRIKDEISQVESLKRELEGHQTRRNYTSTLHEQLQNAESNVGDLEMTLNDIISTIGEVQAERDEMEIRLRYAMEEVEHCRERIPHFDERLQNLTLQQQTTEATLDGARADVRRKRLLVDEAEESLQHIMNAGLTSLDNVSRALTAMGASPSKYSEMWSQEGSVVEDSDSEGEGAGEAKRANAIEIITAKEAARRRRVAHLWDVAYRAVRLGLVAHPENFAFMSLGAGASPGRMRLLGSPTHRNLDRTSPEALSLEGGGGIAAAQGPISNTFALHTIAELQAQVAKLRTQLAARKKKAKAAEIQAESIRDRYDHLRIELVALRAAVAELDGDTVDDLQAEIRFYKKERYELYERLYNHRKFVMPPVKRIYVDDNGDPTDQTMGSIDKLKKKISDQVAKSMASPDGRGYQQRVIERQERQMAAMREQLERAHAFMGRLEGKLQCVETTAMGSFDAYLNGRAGRDEELQRVLSEAAKMQERLLTKQVDERTRHQEEMKEKVAKIDDLLRDVNHLTEKIEGMKSAGDASEREKLKLREDLQMVQRQLEIATAPVLADDLADIDELVMTMKAHPPSSLLQEEVDSSIRRLVSPAQRPATQLCEYILTNHVETLLSLAQSVRSLLKDHVRKTAGAATLSSMVSGKMRELLGVIKRCGRRVAGCCGEVVHEVESQYGHKDTKSVYVQTLAHIRGFGSPHHGGAGGGRTPDESALERDEPAEVYRVNKVAQTDVTIDVKMRTRESETQASVLVRDVAVEALGGAAGGGGGAGGGPGSGANIADDKVRRMEETLKGQMALAREELQKAQQQARAANLEFQRQLDLRAEAEQIALAAHDSLSLVAGLQSELAAIAAVRASMTAVNTQTGASSVNDAPPAFVESSVQTDAALSAFDSDMSSMMQFSGWSAVAGAVAAGSATTGPGTDDDSFTAARSSSPSRRPSRQLLPSVFDGVQASNSSASPQSGTSGTAGVAAAALKKSSSATPQKGQLGVSGATSPGAASLKKPSSSSTASKAGAKSRGGAHTPNTMTPRIASLDTEDAVSGDESAPASPRADLTPLEGAIDVESSADVGQSVTGTRSGGAGSGGNALRASASGAVKERGPQPAASRGAGPSRGATSSTSSAASTISPKGTKAVRTRSDSNSDSSYTASAATVTSKVFVSAGVNTDAEIAGIAAAVQTDDVSFAPAPPLTADAALDPQSPVAEAKPKRTSSAAVMMAGPRMTDAASSPLASPSRRTVALGTSGSFGTGRQQVMVDDGNDPATSSLAASMSTSSPRAADVGSSSVISPVAVAAASAASWTAANDAARVGGPLSQGSAASLLQRAGQYLSTSGDGSATNLVAVTSIISAGSSGSFVALNVKRRSVGVQVVLGSSFAASSPAVIQDSHAAEAVDIDDAPPPALAPITSIASPGVGPDATPTGVVEAPVPGSTNSAAVRRTASIKSTASSDRSDSKPPSRRGSLSRLPADQQRSASSLKRSASGAGGSGSATRRTAATSGSSAASGSAVLLRRRDAPSDASMTKRDTDGTSAAPLGPITAVVSVPNTPREPSEAGGAPGGAGSDGSLSPLRTVGSGGGLKGAASQRSVNFFRGGAGSPVSGAADGANCDGADELQAALIQQLEAQAALHDSEFRVKEAALLRRLEAQARDLEEARREAHRLELDRAAARVSEEASADLEAARATVTSLEEQLEEVRRINETLVARLGTAAGGGGAVDDSDWSRGTRATRAREMRQTQLDEMQRRVRELQRENEAARVELGMERAKVRELEGAVREHDDRQELLRIAKDKDRLEITIQTTKLKSELQDSAERIKKYRLELAQAREVVAAKDKEIEHAKGSAERKLQNLQGMLATVTKERQVLKEELDRLTKDAKYSQARAAQDQVAKIRDDARTELVRAGKDLASERRKVQEMQAKQSEIERQHQRVLEQQQQTEKRAAELARAEGENTSTLSAKERFAQARVLRVHGLLMECATAVKTCLHLPIVISEPPDVLVARHYFDDDSFVGFDAEKVKRVNQIVLDVAAADCVILKRLLQGVKEWFEKMQQRRRSRGTKRDAPQPGSPSGGEGTSDGESSLDSGGDDADGGDDAGGGDGGAQRRRSKKRRSTVFNEELAAHGWRDPVKEREAHFVLKSPGSRHASLTPNSYELAGGGGVDAARLSVPTPSKGKRASVRAPGDGSAPSASNSELEYSSDDHSNAGSRVGTPSSHQRRLNRPLKTAEAVAAEMRQRLELLQPSTAFSEFLKVKSAPGAEALRPSPQRASTPQIPPAQRTQRIADILGALPDRPATTIPSVRGAPIVDLVIDPRTPPPALKNSGTSGPHAITSGMPKRVGSSQRPLVGRHRMALFERSERDRKGGTGELPLI